MSCNLVIPPDALARQKMLLALIHEHELSVRGNNVAAAAKAPSTEETAAGDQKRAATPDRRADA